LRVAVDKVRACTPHGRDYQTVENGQDICLQAQADNIVRVAALEMIREELNAIAEAISFAR
jgi:hypothetical protein